MVVLRAAWWLLAVASAGDVTLAHIHFYESGLPVPSGTKKSRSVYHINSSSDFLGVPAAFVKFRKQYHVFFENIPYENSLWGYQSWGHVISDNLVDWERQRTSLTPKEMYEKNGCLAGSAIVYNGYLSIFYTGKHSNNTQQSQNLAISADGVVFQKYLYNPIITRPSAVIGEFRNPKVWYFQRKWFMIVSSMTRSRLGELLLYVSHDLFNWELNGTIASSFGDMGFMWEHPDIFQLGDTHVLLLCARGVQNDLYNFYQSGYLLGHFNYATNRFTEEFEVSTATFNILDYGHDFYAPKTMLDSDGRRLLIAWLGMWDSTESWKNDGENMMTIVRELRIDPYTENLLMWPARETTQLRAEVLENAWYVPGESFSVGARAFELIVNSSMNANVVQIIVAWSTKKFEILYNANEGYISIDRGGVNGVRRANWSPINKADVVNWRIFVDQHSVEMFCGSGEVVFSSRVHFRRPLQIHVGGDTLLHFKQYRLRRSATYLRGRSRV